MLARQVGTVGSFSWRKSALCDAAEDVDDKKIAGCSALNTKRPGSKPGLFLYSPKSFF